MRILTLILLAAVLSLSGCALAKLPLVAAFPMPSKQPSLGFAQDFEFATLSGETKRLSDFAGHPVVLNFWADW